MQLDNLFDKDSYIYLERYVNKFKKVSNEVSPKYCAMQGENNFYIPNLSLSKKKVEIILASPNKKIYSKLIGNKVKFFVHPDMTEELKDTLDLSKAKNRIIAQPTSSTRTVLPNKENFAIKLHLNKRLSKYIRRLSPSSVKHSLQISKEMDKSIEECPITFGYLPESIGIIYKEIGMIVREMTPRPLILDKRALIPLFSLYSLDVKNPKDKPLFVQFIEKKKANPLQFFLQNIIHPLFANMSYFIKQMGLLLESHGQNVLVEIDDKFNITRLVHRDFQSIYVDKEIRKQNNLSIPFKKHIMGEECKKEISYSLVYDQYVGQYMLDNFLELFEKYLSTQYMKPSHFLKVFRKINLFVNGFSGVINAFSVSGSLSLPSDL